MTRKLVAACAAAGVAALAGCGSNTGTTSSTASSAATVAATPTMTSSAPAAPPPVEPRPKHRRHRRRRPASVSSTTTSLTNTSTATSSASTSSAPAGPTPAIRKALNELLTVDTGAPPTAGDTQAVTADFVRLQGKCRESPEKLAAEIWASDQDLRKNGVQEDAVSVSNHLATVAGGLSTKATPTNCASLLAAYLVLREQ
jgi:hypothetical protein